MEVHFVSKRESKGFERTKEWVVFQLLGLSLWGKRERVWSEEREDTEDGFVRGFGDNDLRKRLSIRWRKLIVPQLSLYQAYCKNGFVVTENGRNKTELL